MESVVDSFFCLRDFLGSGVHNGGLAHFFLLEALIALLTEILCSLVADGQQV